MLCLNRKVGEQIAIGNDIVLKVLSIDRGRVRIGIEAPRDVTVLRSELVIDTEPEEDDIDPYEEFGDPVGGKP